MSWFKTQRERLTLASREAKAAKRYRKLASLVSVDLESDATFTDLREVIDLSVRSIDTACTCDACKWMRKRETARRVT